MRSARVGQQLVLGGQHRLASEEMLQRLLDWAEARGPLISLTAAVDLYANPASGHYIAALVQEARLLVWLGERRALWSCCTSSMGGGQCHAALLHKPPHTRTNSPATRTAI